MPSWIGAGSGLLTGFLLTGQGVALTLVGWGSFRGLRSNERPG